MANIDGRGNNFTFTSGRDVFNLLNGNITVHNPASASESTKTATMPGLMHKFERTSVLKADDYSPNVAMFSPDETHIISCSDKPAITIWDTKTGAVVSGPVRLTPENVAPHGVGFVALSSDGKRMCSGPRSQYGGGTGGGGDNIMRIWDVGTGREVPTPTPLEDTAGITHAALSNDGTKLVTASYNHIRVWDVPTAKSIMGRGAHGGSIFPVAFSAEGKMIASSGQYDKRVNIWDTETVAIVSGPHTDHSGNGDVKSLTFSPDGKKIVMGFEDGKILLMDTTDGDIISDPAEKFHGHTGWITSLAFSPDGNWIVSGSLDGLVRVWDTETGLLTCKPLKGHMSGIRSVAVSRDGRKIVSNSGEAVLVWTLQ